MEEDDDDDDDDAMEGEDCAVFCVDDENGRLVPDAASVGVISSEVGDDDANAGATVAWIPNADDKGGTEERFSEDAVGDDEETDVEEKVRDNSRCDCCCKDVRVGLQLGREAQPVDAAIRGRRLLRSDAIANMLLEAKRFHGRE